MSPIDRSSTTPKSPEELNARRDSLYIRLEQGYDRIQKELENGGDITTWEDFWITLLQEYEKVCYELQQELAN